MAQMPEPTYRSRAADANTGANLVMIGTAKSLKAVAVHVLGHNKDTMPASGRQKHLEMLAFKDVLTSNSAFRTGPAGAGCASRWQDRRLLQFLCEWRGDAAMSRRPGLRRFTRRESLCQADQCRHRGMESIHGFKRLTMVHSTTRQAPRRLASDAGDDPQQLIRLADAAMYAGKQSGKHSILRNQGDLALSS